MVDKSIKILAYPKSGNTYLRFLLANIFWPYQEHDFDSVRSLIPNIDSKKEISKSINAVPKIVVSHNHKFMDDKSYILFRYIGDVLESFYYHNKKFYNQNISFDDYLKQTDYGKDWREFVDYTLGRLLSENYSVNRILKYEHFINSTPIFKKLSFDLGNVKLTGMIADICNSFHLDMKKYLIEIDDSLIKSSFSKMKKIEDTEGLGNLYQDSDQSISFVRSGKSLQWIQWSKINVFNLLSKNETQLKKLGYWDDVHENIIADFSYV